MALQATLTLLCFDGLATMAAVLCAVVLMWWALGTRGALPVPAKEMRLNPFDNATSTPFAGAQGHVDAASTDLDLDIDFEAFQAQIKHDFETLQLQIRRRCDLTFRGMGTDFEAFQAQIEHQCDMEMDALCESAIDDQSAKVLKDLEDEFEGGPVGAQDARRHPVSAEPWMDFEANVELHSDRALEGMWTHADDSIDEALDGMCAAVLKALEDECRGSSVLDSVSAAVCTAARN